MSDDENKAIVRRVIEMLDLGNAAAAAEEHPGLYETGQRQPLLHAAFPDLRTTIDHQIVEGDWVATHVTLRGTHRGEFMGVAPTEKHLEWGGLMLDQIVDAKIVLHYAYLNYVSVLMQFGVIPVPRGTST